MEKLKITKVVKLKLKNIDLQNVKCSELGQEESEETRGRVGSGGWVVCRR